MSGQQKSAVGWVAVTVTALGLAGTAAFFVARSAAASEVRPLEQRVSVVETERARDHEDLKEIKEDVKAILSEVRKR